MHDDFSSLLLRVYFVIAAVIFTIQYLFHVGCLLAWSWVVMVQLQVLMAREAADHLRYFENDKQRKQRIFITQVCCRNERDSVSIAVNDHSNRTHLHSAADTITNNTTYNTSANSFTSTFQQVKISSGRLVGSFSIPGSYKQGRRDGGLPVHALPTEINPDGSEVVNRS